MKCKCGREVYCDCKECYKVYCVECRQDLFSVCGCHYVCQNCNIGYVYELCGFNGDIRIIKNFQKEGFGIKNENH